MTREPGDKEGETQRGHVGEHVAGIGQQREGIRQKSAYHLGHQEQCGQDEGESQSALRGRVARSIQVEVTVRMPVGVRALFRVLVGRRHVRKPGKLLMCRIACYSSLSYFS